MTNKTYIKGGPEPSEMFIDSLSNGGVGSDELTCHCGRLHLCPDNRYAERDIDDNKDFAEYCEEEFKKNPDNVILHYGCDSVLGKDFNGSMFVLDCPCNTLYKYEQFIWAERKTIRAYLKLRTNEELRFAENEKLMNVMAGIDD